MTDASGHESSPTSDYSSFLALLSVKDTVDGNVLICCCCHMPYAIVDGRFVWGGHTQPNEPRVFIDTSKDSFGISLPLGA